MLSWEPSFLFSTPLLWSCLLFALFIEVLELKKLLLLVIGDRVMGPRAPSTTRRWSSQRVDKTSTSEAQKVFSWFHLAEFFFSLSCAKGKNSFPLTASFPGFYRAFCFLIYFSTMFGCKELIRIQIRKLQWTGTWVFFFFFSLSTMRINSRCFILGNLPCNVVYEW